MEKYKKDLEHSYTFGTFPTFELLKNKSKYVEKILIHEKLERTDDVKKLIALAEKLNIYVETASKQIEKIADKENCLVVGVFRKYVEQTENNDNHIVLVNPSDMGNLGTIFRTALGFDIKNIVLITPCADYFNPKVIRASMGAIFSLNIQTFSSFNTYKQLYTSRYYYPFMLKAKTTLQEMKASDKKQPYSLIFGNEATGLSDEFLDLGMPIIITHSKNIDSLNLPISTSIAMYEFSK